MTCTKLCKIMSFGSATPMSPVIIGRLPAKMNSKKWSSTEGITESTISAICVNVAIRAGVRKLSEDYDHRYVNKVTYGFRKHFETTILNALNKDGSNHSRNGGLPMLKHYDDSGIKDVFQYYKLEIIKATNMTSSMICSMYNS